MQFDDLKEFVIRGNRGGLCQALATLDEKQRQQLGDDALKLFTTVDEYAFEAADVDLKTIEDPQTAELVGAMKKQKYADWRIPRLAAGLCVLGLCDQKVIAGPMGSWFQDDLHDMPHRVLQILDDRRPKWLASWIAKDVVREFPTVTWYVERGLIRSGALPPDNSDGYLQRMAEQLYVFVGNNSDFEVSTDDTLDAASCPDTITDALLADPDLLESEVWRLFEVETRAFVYDWGWRESIVGLSAAGKLDRGRLLRACLQAMTLPFRKQTLSGFVKLHDEFEPTLEEREELVQEYLRLLDNEVPQIVGVAMKALDALAVAKRLNAGAFFEACPPIFLLANKAQPRKAIKLAKKLLKADPGLAPAAAKAVAAGVGSVSPDVQEDALGLLESLKDEVREEVQAEMRAWTDNVAAALRPRFDALLQSSVQPQGDRFTAESAVPSSGQVSDFQDRVQALSDPLRERAGVNAALHCLQDGADPFPTPIDPRHVPRRDPAATVEPLASLDELIDTVAALVERVDDVMVVEQVLDGIARFHADRPKDFEKRVAPLKKRIEARSERYSHTVLDRGADVGLSQLIRRWLDMPPVHREWGNWWNLAGAFFRDRTDELSWRINRAEPGDRDTAPMLSLPTHRHGWLDPVAFAKRLDAYRFSYGNYLVPSYDFAQALLRLTPDGRDEALKILPADGRGTTFAVAQFVLGADIELAQPGGIGAGGVMLAAAHARALIDDPANLELPFTLPIAKLDENGERQLVGPLADDPAMPADLLSKAHSLLAIPESWGAAPGHADWLAEWQNLIWPANRGPICLYASLTSASSVYLHNLLDPDMSWGEEACRLAAWATGAGQSVAKGLITDALIEGMGGGTIDPVRLGRHLAAVSPHLKLNRVAAVLDETSRISALHHWAVFKTLETCLSQLDKAPRDLHHLLTVLLESATVTGKTLGKEASGLLTSVKGASKTAKLAQQVLAVQAAPERMQAVCELALQACLDRAERWRARSAPS